MCSLSKGTLDELVIAGDGDLLPRHGLHFGRVHVFPADGAEIDSESNAEGLVRLTSTPNGWGTGCHPTTALCLNFLSDVIMGGETIVDYGTGSGVLTVASLSLGAARVTSVDVEFDALEATQKNLELNNFDDRAELLHVREVVPGGLVPKADIIVANILVGQLVRPSMVAALCGNLMPNGLLCLSGIRPSEVPSLKEAYGDLVDWEESMYCEADPGSEGMHYWGRWARLVGRAKARQNDTRFVEMLSEMAVN